ncbi:MAG TPA: hypothetical protein VGX28_11140 [Frankiaceae bacterium]|nr:hypothetical protein [Frankiaceae bacterium]
MRPEAVLPFVATVIAWEFSLALLRRWWRSRRPYLRSWALSLLFFATGAAFLTYGTAFGWSGASLRGYYVFGALLSVPWLAMGEVELLWPGRATRVLAVFLAILSVDAALVLAASDFVTAVPVAGYAVPHGKDFFAVLPRVLVVVSNVVGTFVVLGGTVWSGLRARRSGAAARARFRGTLVIALGVAIAALGGALAFLSEVASQATTLTVGVAVMYAGFVLASRPPRTAS